MSVADKAEWMGFVDELYPLVRDAWPSCYLVDSILACRRTRGSVVGPRLMDYVLWRLSKLGYRTFIAFEDGAVELEGTDIGFSMKKTLLGIVRDAKEECLKENLNLTQVGWIDASRYLTERTNSLDRRVIELVIARQEAG